MTTNCVFVEPNMATVIQEQHTFPLWSSSRMNPQWLLYLTMSMLHIEERLYTDQRLIQEVELFFCAVLPEHTCTVA